MIISPVEMLIHIFTPIGVVVASYLAIRSRDLLAAAILIFAVRATKRMEEE